MIRLFLADIQHTVHREWKDTGQCVQVLPLRGSRNSRRLLAFGRFAGRAEFGRETGVAHIRVASGHVRILVHSQMRGRRESRERRHGANLAGAGRMSKKAIEERADGQMSFVCVCLVGITSDSSHLSLLPIKHTLSYRLEHVILHMISDP